jgi:hypothetical protein
MYLGDEASKWEYLSYLSHWSNIKPTMIQGGRVGKSFIGSTLNPIEGVATLRQWTWVLMY